MCDLPVLSVSQQFTYMQIAVQHECRLYEKLRNSNRRKILIV